MQKKNVILFLVFLLSITLYYLYVDNFTTTSNVIKHENIKVIRVLDGDTLELENKEKIRLLGINTPEKKTFLSNESTAFTKQLENKTVDVEVLEKDKYGRSLGYVFYNSLLINEEILKRGFAHLFVYEEDKYTSRLKSAEQYARENQLGLWKKSPNFGCIALTEFKHTEDGERCTNKERIILENFCTTLQVYLKDDATHDENITLSKGTFEKNFSCIFNDEGDSLYIWDEKGLLVFQRY